MAKLRYISPIVLNSNGIIDMTLSQNGNLSDGVVNDWNGFWAEAEDFVKEYYPDFDINDSTTWPDGFLGLEDPDSWFALLEEPTNP